MATKTTTKATSGKAWKAAADDAKAKAAKTKDDRLKEVFRLRVEALDGLLHVAAELAGKIDESEHPPGFEDMNRELYAIISALPVFADALTSYGAGGYEYHSFRPDVTLSQHLGHLQNTLRLAEPTAGRRTC